MDTDATITLEDTTLGRVSEVAGFGFSVSSASNVNLKTNVLFDRVLVANATGATTIKPTGVEFPDLTVQTSAGISAATAASTYQTLAGMSSYLTTASAASTYAITSRGQPASGTVGQVLTKNSGTNYDSSWTTIIPGDRYLTTSSTSNTVSNGNKTFTVGTGLSYTPTQNLTIAYDASHHMHGEVLTYNSGTGVLTVDINNHTGTGTYASWVVNVGGVTPLASVAWGAITGTLGDQTDLATALNDKLEVSTAAATYYPLTGNPSSFLTPSDLIGYATESWVSSGYYPLTGNPSSFLTDAPSDGSTYGRNNGAWAVAGGGGFITSVTAPLSVTSNDLSVDLTAYLALSGGTMTGSITSFGATHDTEMAGDLFGVQLSADHTKGTTVEFDGLDTYDGASHMQVNPTGLIFPDATTQLTAGIGNAPNDGSYYAMQSLNWAAFSPGIGDAPSDGTYYGRQYGAWAAVVPEAPSDGTTYGRNNATWVATAVNPPHYNYVWAYGGWQSATVTNIYDTGSSMYYNVLTF
jgi:hypothetical protein